MVLDFSKSLALRAVGREKKINHLAFRILKWTGSIGTALSTVIGVGSLLGWINLPNFILGLVLVVLGLCLGLLVADLYLYGQYIGIPRLVSLSQALVQSPPPNLADYLTREAALLVRSALNYWGNDEKIFPPILLLFAASQSPANWALARLGIIFSSEEANNLVTSVKKSNADNTGDGILLRVFEVAAEHASQARKDKIDDSDIMQALFSEDVAAKKILFDFKSKSEDVANAFNWLTRLRALTLEIAPYNRQLGAGIAEDWTSGYTPYLSKFTNNLTRNVKSAGKFFALHGHAKEITQLERLLSKGNASNVILVGPSGIGKETVVMGLAQKLYLGLGPEKMRYQQILSLDIQSVIAGESDRGEIEARLNRLFAEAARAGNIILLIENIHHLIGGGDRVGGIDASELLASALRAEGLHIVATTTPEEFQARIAKSGAIATLFERIDMLEPAKNDVMEILEDAILPIENETGAFFTEQALRDIVEIADRYVHDQPFPQKALNLAADLASYVMDAESRWVTPEVVSQVLSEKLKMPLASATGEEQKQLLNLEAELHETVVDQEEAIGAIGAALRRARAGLAGGKRPIASFLFLGPTGVGKTESAKALARVYFGDPISPSGLRGAGENHMIRLDMSEYQQVDGLARLIGAPSTTPGVKTGGVLVDAIHDQPFSLLLLDELEKAHPQILNLFLQVLDDGRLTDGSGRVIDFTNTIIIATSNAGAELIRESIAANEDQEARRRKLVEYLQSQGIYRPEFLNRFDGVVAFRPLAPEHVLSIVKLMLGDLKNRLAKEREINLSFSDDLVVALAKAGFDPAYGARPIRRLIQDKVESFLANQILGNKITRGGTLTLTSSLVNLTT